MLENSKERIQRKLSRDKSQSTPELRPTTPTPTAADIMNGLGLDGAAAGGSGSKLSHQCIQDYQLLAQDEIVQEIYDCLCATLGDVYSVELVPSHSMPSRHDHLSLCFVRVGAP